LRPETAYILTNVMKGVVERGTATRARVLNRPVAGKTGTTSEATDVWFVGFTPNLVAGVWLGYDVKRSLGPEATGGRLALPVWITFMQRILEDLPPDDFTAPMGVVGVPVNLASGLPASPGETGAILEYFRAGTEPRPAGPNGGSPPAAGAPTAPQPGIAPSPAPVEPNLVPPSVTTGGSPDAGQR
jgi:penicillin-binding protein 1A